MASFTLDDIKAAAEKKYGATEVDLGDGSAPVRLVNVMRLPKLKRDQLLETQKSLKDEGADQEAGLQEILRLVAESPVAVERLIEAAGDDLAVLVTVFEKYSSGTELGEASASQS